MFHISKVLNKIKYPKNDITSLGPNFSCANQQNWKTKIDLESTLSKLCGNIYIYSHPQSLRRSKKSRFEMELYFDILQSGQFRIPETIEFEWEATNKRKAAVHAVDISSETFKNAQKV